jgi:hypothetical protein
MHSRGLVQLDSRAVLLGVEIRVLAVSSMWTACYVSAVFGLGRGRGRVQSSHVKLAAVEMDLGWPLPRYAIPVIVSVLAGAGSSTAF